jgi:1-acyl-sn-glycerol-3-phosphate acyltransferase
MGLLYQMGYRFFDLSLGQLNHLTIHNPERFPKNGGLILASNHASHLDPPALGTAVTRACGRELHFMARSTLFKPDWWGSILHSVNSHPIIRGNGPDQDWQSFVDVVKSGYPLLVFPEGTRTQNGELQRGKSGFGKIVHMSQAPVYAAFVQGSFEAFPKGGKYHCRPISIYFGQEVLLADLLSQPEEKRVIREISDRVMQAIADLKATVLGPGTSYPVIDNSR